MATGHLLQRLVFQPTLKSRLHQAVFPCMQHGKSTFLQPGKLTSPPQARTLYLSRCLRDADKGPIQTGASPSQGSSFSVLKYIKKPSLSVKLGVPTGNLSSGPAKSTKEMKENIELPARELIACGLVLGLLLHLYNGRSEARSKLIMALEDDQKAFHQHAFPSSLLQSMHYIKKEQPLTPVEVRYCPPNALCQDGRQDVSDSDDFIMAGEGGVAKSVALDPASCPREEEGDIYCTGLVAKEEEEEEDFSNEGMEGAVYRDEEQTMGENSVLDPEKRKPINKRPQLKKKSPFLLDRLKISKICSNGDGTDKV